MHAEERSHIEQLLQANLSVLRDLELKAASFGDLYVPTHITLQIEQQRGKIAELEQQLRALLPHHNLPQRDYELFVGRAKELAELRRLLQPYPKSRAYVITIDGIGGIGKSALALEIAATFRDSYAQLPEAERFDAIVWVSAKRSYLTADGILERSQAFRTLSDLYRAIAAVLDFPAITRARAEDQRGLVEDALREQRTLLILDNLETVDDEELLVFLRELPDPTKAIVTTRHRIDVAHPVRLTGMPREDAQRLIEQESARKNVVLAAEEQEQLWQRTGGVPLAIVWSIGLMGLGGSVESVLRRLGSGQSDIARFCFEQSVAQIRGRDAYWLLLALALFASDASREALGVVAGLGDDEFGRDVGLEELLRLSLVNKEGERFSFLPLTRGFAQSHKDQHSQWFEQAQARLYTYYNQFIRNLRGGWRDWGRYDRFERDITNCFAILNELAARIQFVEAEATPQMLDPAVYGQVKRLNELIDIMARFLRLRGYWADYERFSRISITLCKLTNETGKLGWRYRDLGRMYYLRGDFEQAKQFAMSALEIGQAGNQRILIGESWLLLAYIARNNGDLHEAKRLMEAIHEMYQSPEDFTSIPNFMGGLGLLSEEQGDLATAEAWYRQAIEISRKNDELPDLAFNLLGIGRVMLLKGDLAAAANYFTESLSSATACGSAEALANAHYRLAILFSVQRQAGRATAHARQALDIFRRLGMKREQAEAEALLGQVSAGEPPVAGAQAN